MARRTVADNWYIDTSVLAAYYCPESLSETVERALASRPTPFISSLTEVELASVVSRKHRTGELAAANCQQILRLFQQHRSERCFKMAPLSQPQYQQARDWIGTLSTPLRTLDALHLASALAVSAAILTADTVMHRAAIKLGVNADLVT
jgi:uncharacterized protein